MSSVAGVIAFRQSSGCLKARKVTVDGMARLVTHTFTKARFTKVQELRLGSKWIGTSRRKEDQ